MLADVNFRSVITIEWGKFFQPQDRWQRAFDFYCKCTHTNPWRFDPEPIAVDTTGEYYPPNLIYKAKVEVDDEERYERLIEFCVTHFSSRKYQPTKFEYNIISNADKIEIDNFGHLDKSLNTNQNNNNPAITDTIEIDSFACLDEELDTNKNNKNQTTKLNNMDRELNSHHEKTKECEDNGNKRKRSDDELVNNQQHKNPEVQTKEVDEFITAVFPDVNKWDVSNSLNGEPCLICKMFHVNNSAMYLGYQLLTNKEKGGYCDALCYHHKHLISEKLELSKDIIYKVTGDPRFDPSLKIDFNPNITHKEEKWLLIRRVDGCAKWVHALRWAGFRLDLEEMRVGVN